MLSSFKIISKSLNGKNVQFGLDRAYVFVVGRHFINRAIHARPVSLKIIVILMSRLWWSHHETLQYVSKLISLSSVKFISKSLNGEHVQFGIDRAHVFYS